MLPKNQRDSDEVLLRLPMRQRLLQIALTIIHRPSKLTNEDFSTATSLFRIYTVCLTNKIHIMETERIVVIALCKRVSVFFLKQSLTLRDGLQLSFEPDLGLIRERLPKTLSELVSDDPMETDSDGFLSPALVPEECLIHSFAFLLLQDVRLSLPNTLMFRYLSLMI